MERQDIITSFIKHNEKLYKVRREIKMKRFEEGGVMKMEWVKEFRDYLLCNHVLKVGEKFIFCEEVEDAEVIEE